MTNENTRVLASSDYRKEAIQFLRSLRNLLENSSSVLVESEEGSETIFWRPEIAASFSKPSGITNTLSRMLLDGAGRSEIIGAGSSTLVLHAAIEASLHILKQVEAGQDIKSLIEAAQDDARWIQEQIQVVTRWPCYDDILDILDSISESEKEREIVTSAIKLAGLSGKIFVEETKLENTSIELKNEHEFDLYPVSDVMIDGDLWSKENVRIALIDGIVESVSEIHSLLDGSAKNCEPCVIFARGFSEEVIATIGVNRRRQTLDVLPVRVPFDENSANTLKDIGAIVQSDVVTALQGQLISAMKWNDLIAVDAVSFSPGKMCISSKGEFASFLAKELLDRRADMLPGPNRDALDKRIKSLMSSTVTIRLSSDDTKRIGKRVDLMLRSVRSIVSYGVIDVNDLENVLSREDSFFVHSFATSINSNAYFGKKPAISFAAMVKFSLEVAIAVAKTEVVILLDL